MSANTFGNQLRLTTFGESHGIGVGGILDGFPSGIKIDMELIALAIERRSTSAFKFGSPRVEPDQVQILSGVYEGFSLGTPIAFVIKNQDTAPGDYEYLKDIYRPSHADFTYDKKFGIYDPRGGGRASARETISRVVGGAFASMLLKQKDIQVCGYTKQIGNLCFEKSYKDISDWTLIENSPVRCPDPVLSEAMLQLLDTYQQSGDSLGGVVTCVIRNCPAGLGEPVFDKLPALLAHAMMSLPAAKGFEIGEGFRAATMSGFEHNDLFATDFTTTTNHAGGVLGGISSGEDIYFHVAFKPIATISKEQFTADKKGQIVSLKNRGRHDICAVPRAVPIVEAMTALVVADLSLCYQQKS